jgi:hypothetical protein
MEMDPVRITFRDDPSIFISFILAHKINNLSDQLKK